MEETANAGLPKPTPRWFEYVTKRLQDLQYRASDPEGAATPESAVIERTRRIVHDLLGPDTPTPSVVPSETGGILLIWHKAGWDLEVEIQLEDVTVWGRRRDPGEMWSGPLGEMQAKLTGVLGQFAARG